MVRLKISNIRQPAIIIAAYNRPAALGRLLHSLNGADYPIGGIPLVISIDYGGGEGVKQVAKGFNWQHGDKEIIAHPSNLGLRKHILACGDLSQRYGSILLLEDDLLISPAFYRYALLALSHYADEKQVAGLALYSYRIAEGSLAPFSPLPGNDTYLMQVPCSWGQVWTAGQWTAFRQWMGHWDGAFRHLPVYMRYWSAHSWKKVFAEYLLDTGRYFLYPRMAFSSNPGEAGTNYKSKQSLYEVPLRDNCKGFRPAPFGECIRYDAHFEMESEFLPDTLGIPKNDISLDLRGSKCPEEIPTGYVITRQQCRRVLRHFPKGEQPLELNLLNGRTGRGLSLCKVSDMRFGWLFRLQNRLRPYYYTRAKFWNKVRMTMGKPTR